MISFLFLFVLFYLVGSINTATLVSKFSNIADPRLSGSRNPGATNMLRIHGKKIGLLVFLGDFLKGYAPIYFYLNHYYLSTEAYLLMWALILGHCYSYWLKFQGGKGFATFLGILFALNASLGWQSILVWISLYSLTRISALSALSVCMFVLGFCSDHREYFFLSLSTVLVLWRHKPNWQKWAQAS